MASPDTSLFSLYENEAKKEKSPSALRTISEASELLDIPQHVLRFWETKFSQIKPLKRNGGRRFYRPQDLDVLQQIKHLLYNQGYTIKGAKKAIDEFIHARAGQHITPTEWLETVPPANMNDNFIPETPDAFAELAQALAEPENAAPLVQEDSLSREKLFAMRAELIAARDVLHRVMPSLASASHA